MDRMLDVVDKNLDFSIYKIDFWDAVNTSKNKSMYRSVFENYLIDRDIKKIK